MRASKFTGGIPRLCPTVLPTQCLHIAGISSCTARHSKLYTSVKEHGRHRLRVAQAVQAPPRQAPPAQPEVQVDGVEVVAVTKGITLLRGICMQRFKFEIEYGLKRGTTDNSYLIKDEEAVALVDVPDQAFTEPFMRALQNVVQLRSVQHLVLTHLSPKRIGALKAFLEARVAETGAPQLEVTLSNPALQLLRSSLGADEKGAALLSAVTLTVTRSNSTVKLGSGAELQLIPAITPRWPDLLSVYYPPDKALLTSKLFSAHVAPAAAGAPSGSAFDAGGWDVYGNDWRYYFDCMLAPVARQAAGALEKLESTFAPAAAAQPGGPWAAILSVLQRSLTSARDALEAQQLAAFGAQSMGLRSGVARTAQVVSVLLPMHGPAIRSSVAELLRQYLDWTRSQIAAAQLCRVAVLYASAYGNTAALAQAISRGITKAGVGVETLNLETVGLDEVTAAVSQSAGFVIGSPTLGGHMPTQVQTALGAVLREAANKALPCGVFGSFGWSGEAVDEMEQRLRDAGFQFAFDSIRVKFKPTAKDLQLCEESGTDLAQLLKKKLKRKEKQAANTPVKSAASGMEQAVGRILGSLCAITAGGEDDARGAMLASWISQASFDPPGLSVAVKKDRQVEALLPIGAKFVVNIMAEGNEKVILKELLKPFKPGEERLGGLETRISEASGCQIIEGCAAYLECSVKDRLETGDHYVVYAVVDSGGVLQENALSAVHHRRTGTTY